ncbi:MAG: hypothetical protein ACO34E_11110 [Limisphaerales bacterium]
MRVREEVGLGTPEEADLLVDFALLSGSKKAESFDEPGEPAIAVEDEGKALAMGALPEAVEIRGMEQAPVDGEIGSIGFPEFPRLVEAIDYGDPFSRLGFVGNDCDVVTGCCERGAESSSLIFQSAA